MTEQTAKDHPDHRFAAINGWRRSNPFTMRRLAGRRSIRTFGSDEFPCTYSANEDPDCVMDHVCYFKHGSKAVAIVTMPYNANAQQAQAIAERYGLTVATPPLPHSGWHAPGHTHCFAFVRPGTSVIWLPEQQQQHHTQGEAP
jgi:hypothetical protein